MDTRRLELLVALARLGSMHEVAVDRATSTSTVSQALSALAREVGTPLLEPDGRRVRLTPAGRRLAEHAVTILASVDAARLDLDPTAEPRGVVQVAGFATGIRRSLLPAIDAMAVTHPSVKVRIHEHEPAEALDLLGRDRVDLALVYDYDLAPAHWPSELDLAPLWEKEWGLGLPTGGGGAALADHAGSDWIVNSRDTADEQVLLTLASLAGFTPRVVHHVDSLELVEDLIRAGRGVALLPRGRPARRGVIVRGIRDPGVTLRSYAATRRGRQQWPPLRILLARLRQMGTAA